VACRDDMVGGHRGREQREADEISRKALNPGESRGSRAHQQTANKQFAAGERQFDSILVEDESDFVMGPAKTCGRLRNLACENGLSASVLPDDDGRPLSNCNCSSRSNDDSKLVRIPPRTC
jgi:hypothetical protein